MFVIVKYGEVKCIDIRNILQLVMCYVINVGMFNFNNVSVKLG